MRPRLILALALIPTLAGAAAHADSEKKKGGGDSYLQFPCMVATLNMGGGRRGVLMVETGLDVPDGGLRLRADQLQPRLRDAYLRFLMTYAASLTPGTLPNTETISVSMQRTTDEVLGQPGAKFLLGSVIEN